MKGLPPSSTFSLDIQIADELDDVPAEILQNELTACLMALAQMLPEVGLLGLSRDVCVRLCDEAESQALNRDYRGRDKPTNVLSFALQESEAVFPVAAGGRSMGEQPVLPLGDLAICWPIVVREARQQQKTTNHHLSHLFIHGVLHLLGWEHEAPAEALAMEKTECAALAQMGIADPYVSEAADA